MAIGFNAEHGKKIDNLNTGLGQVSSQLAEIIQQEIPNIDDKKLDKTGIVTMVNMGQDVKEAMTGGSVAVVGINAVLNENIVDRQITPEKTTYVKTGRNMFDRFNTRTGKSLNSSGIEVNNTGACVSNYIPIVNVAKLYGKMIYQYAFYNSSMQYIVGSYVSLPVNSNAEIVPPVGAYYIKIVVSYSVDALTPTIKYGIRGSGLFLEDSVYVPEYISYINNEEPISEILPSGKNLFDKDKVEKGYVVDRYAKNVYSELHSTSISIKVKANENYTISNATTVIQLDRQKRAINNSYEASLNPIHTLKTDVDTKYIKVSVLTSNLEVCQIEKGDVATPHEAIRYSLYSNGEKFLDLSDISSKGTTNNLLALDGYSKTVDSEHYQIYEYAKDSKKIVALRNNIAIRTNQDLYSNLSGDIGTIIEISETGLNGSFDKNVVFNATNFPNLISESKIHQIVIIPWTRNRTSFVYGYQWRMCVLTDKGQIYHNFPSRSTTTDGSEIIGDITRFEESVIWDLPTRKFPSKNVTTDVSEYYFPCLPDTCYEMHPAINTSSYGNGGFPKYLEKDGKVFPRFYQPLRLNSNTTPFRFMGGFEPTEKLTLLGTYNLNNTVGLGTRICVFATDDGGRNWYCKYDFADSRYGDSLTIGNTIDLTGVEGTYVTDSLKFNARFNVIPSDATKNPTENFIVRPDIIISDISKTNPAIITTKTAHGLNARGLIALKNNGSSTDFDWMCNNNFNTTSHGNGIFFKVEVIDSTHLRLYEYVSSWDNNLPCRHIHCINRVKDGFTLGTGERYPDTWLFYIPMHEGDSSDKVTYAHKDLTFTRLNSSSNGLSRPLGVILKDDAEQTIYFASDESVTYRGDINLGNGETITRSSLGVFKGKLSNVDDMSSFYPILESKEPSFYFKEHNGVFVHIGQRGEFSISFDQGITWSTKQFSGDFQKPNGHNNQFIVISGLIVALKK